MKIIGIGVNYNKSPDEKKDIPDDLMIFSKPETALASGSVFHYPSCSEKVFYEMEIVLKLNKTLKEATLEEAFNSFDEIALGIDWTAKDLQRGAKEKGWPWVFAKGFDESAFLSDWIPVREFENVRDLDLTFKVNGEIRQQGNTRQMIAAYEHIIAYASRFMTLEPGDIIMSGTPPTAGETFKGDHAEGFIGNTKYLDFKVV
ncbi:fumarylacetoacetate hydrolase family protein [Fulvivirga sp. M361]|uniref:fumarylacetoacetate hydrolase family protein n=1 Tax=Fulvivirga sp. M361 TaxID=2594266 RepID=UPI00117B37DD|nr:fumarylacetoacetate hydrolase family protein [Fulvivirga sp. M361]TRX48567.1 fumarylacetoacetate hydrolase family protein [Fulvivirga sp. M361]